jgi:hypothetical protein
MYVEKRRERHTGAASNGIVIEDLMGNPHCQHRHGGFLARLSGLYYKNGVKEPFQGGHVLGNVFDISGTSRKQASTSPFTAPVGSPSIYVEGLKISGNVRGRFQVPGSKFQEEDKDSILRSLFETERGNGLLVFALNLKPET